MKFPELTHADSIDLLKIEVAVVVVVVAVECGSEIDFVEKMLHLDSNRDLCLMKTKMTTTTTRTKRMMR